MNLREYIFQKGLEKAQIEFLKQAILEDKSLSYQQKVAMIRQVETLSQAKDVAEIILLLSGR